jgi:flagellar hook-associated protein 2
MTSISSTASLLTASTASTTSSTSTSSSSSSDSIDWDDLIEGAVQAKLVKADNIDLKITANETKIAAYQDMQSLLLGIADAAQALRAPSGTSLQVDDAFLSRTAYLTANGNVDAASSVSATVDSGAEVGSFDLAVIQLARAHKVAGADLADSTEGLGYQGVLSLGIDGGTSADITIRADMSLDEVAEAINGQKSTTGVQASVLKISDNAYRLVLSTVETGQTITASSVSGDDVLGSMGITDSVGGFADVLQDSSRAIIEVDGIEITRSSNDIDDVVSGVTLHLYQTTSSGTSITVEVGNDLNVVKEAITALVDAYNAYRDFAYAQQKMPSGTEEDAVLFGDGALRNVNTAVSNALAAMINAQSIGTLGLSFDETNHLVLDEDVLDNALLSDIDAIQSLLSFQMASSSSDLMLLSRGTQLPAAFALEISVGSDGSITGASVDGDSSLFTIDGTRIIGAEGSIYEGYSLVFTGTSSSSVDVSFNTGIAEFLYNAADAAAEETDGSLAGLIDNLDDVNADLEAKSADARAQAETYRTNLTARYAQYQAAIAAAESSQAYLTSLLDTWNSSS